MYDPRVHIGVAVFVPGGSKYLWIKRSPDASHGANLWSIPGGWVDYGEAPVDTAMRELKEETGIVLQCDAFYFLGVEANTYPELDMHVICLFYEAKPELNGMMPEFENLEPEKHSEMRLAKLGAFEDNELFPPIRDYLRRLRGEAV